MPDTVTVQKNPTASWKLPFSAAGFSVLLRAMLDEAGYEGAAVELALLDDESMESLNQDSMDCVGPTNILSFPAGYEDADIADAAGARGAFGADEGERPVLGWLALSADTLLRECFLYGQDAEAHCIRLLAHGLAHLMGQDHGPEMDSLAGRMEAAAYAARRFR